MKRNNFLKSFLAIPFIAPLLEKSAKPKYIISSSKPYRFEDNPLSKMVIDKESMIITKGDNYTYLYDKPKKSHVWKEEQIKEGLWIHFPINVPSLPYIIACITLNFHTKEWGSITNAGYWISIGREGTSTSVVNYLNYYNARPATKAEVIQMIMNSNNFI